jgi:enoyl-CoA hydratase
MSALLPRAVGTRLARQMMTTGEPIDAGRALAAGLVTEVVPHGRLLARSEEIAARIVAAHRGAVEVTLDLVHRGDGASLPHALGLEAEAKLRWRVDVEEVGRRFAALLRRRV